MRYRSAWAYQSREVLSHGVEGLSCSKNRRGSGRSFPRVCLGAEPVNNILSGAKCLVLFHEGINETIRGCPHVVPNRGPRHESLVVVLDVGKIFCGHVANPLRLVGSLPGASYTRLDWGTREQHHPVSSTGQPPLQVTPARCFSRCALAGRGHPGHSARR
jgi:hypothetical protein